MHVSYKTLTHQATCWRCPIAHFGRSFFAARKLALNAKWTWNDRDGFEVVFEI